MTNPEIAALLTEMAVLLELDAANPFRIRAYQRAAQTLSSLAKPLLELSPEEVLEVPGIGKGIAEHIKEIKASGSFKELGEFRKRFPPGLLELLKVQGLGPKRARFLFDTIGIASLGALKKAAEAGRLRDLRGFGQKMEENILKGLEFGTRAQRTLLWDARQIVAELCASLRKLPRVSLVEPAGSLRRGRETVGDVDILCAAADGAPVIEAFTKLSRVERILAAGETKARVNLKGGLQCDLRVVPPSSFGAALQYFTGSKEHNVVLRELALKRGLTINEYGVFKVSDKKQTKPVAGRTEEEVYKAVGLPWIAPELRENRGEIAAALVGKLPRLVELKDVRGDFHNHSNHTDGAQSLEEMARAAKEQGWEWAALGDHSQSLKVTRGLDVPRLRRSIKELAEIRRKIPGVALLRSMEVDILEDGRMDYADDVLDEIDVVIASVHSRFQQPEAVMTKRLAKAASNPHVDIMGHLSGRLINKRPPYEFNAEEVLKAAAENKTAVEINGQPERHDVDDVRAKRARELGAPLALTTDAHAADQFENMSLAVTIARRAWLEPKDIINCMGEKDLQKWLKDRHQ